MDDKVDAELKELFRSELELAVITELKSIMRTFDLAAQAMFFKWESYCINREMDQQNMSVGLLRPFKQDLMDALERSTRAKAHIKTEKRMGTTPRTVTRTTDVYDMLEGMATPGSGKLSKSGSIKKRILETPSVSRVKANMLSSSPDYKTPGRPEEKIPFSSFDERTTAGEVVEVLNNHLDAGEPPIAPYGESRIKLTAQYDQKKLAYRPLAMKLSETSEILDDRIDDFADLIARHYNLDDSVFGSAASRQTEEIVAVGRIASDTVEGASEAAEGKLNAASVVLEMSRRTGAGLRVPLKLDRLKGYQFFPGQIVAFRGTNASGSAFVVSEELKLPILPNAASTPSAMNMHRTRMRGGPDAMDVDDSKPPPPLNIMFAAGPYTADDNLDFEPLRALCKRAADEYADALVLAGPFVDAEHPLIASGDFDLPEEAYAAGLDPDSLTMTAVFKWMVAPAINSFTAANPQATVLLVPHVRDVLDKHVSWPQDTLPRARELGLQHPKAVKVAGNPVTLGLNEVVLGASSQDVLFELGHEELVSAPPDPVRLSRVARYLIEQRHYFPLFPPADRRKLPRTGTAEGIPPGATLDVSYLKLGEMGNARPDVLFVPSALSPFVKVIESVVVINPGFLSKRRGPGTYARMVLHAPKLTDEEMSSGADLQHKVFQRARVEITKI